MLTYAHKIVKSFENEDRIIVHKSRKRPDAISNISIILCSYQQKQDYYSRRENTVMKNNYTANFKKFENDYENRYVLHYEGFERMMQENKAMAEEARKSRSLFRRLFSSRRHVKVVSGQAVGA